MRAEHRQEDLDVPLHQVVEQLPGAGLVPDRDVCGDASGSAEGFEGALGECSAHGAVPVPAVTMPGSSVRAQDRAQLLFGILGSQ